MIGTFGIQVKCHVCGMSILDERYETKTDHQGYLHSTYWANPKLSPYTDVVLCFCGPIHSVEWYHEQRFGTKKGPSEDGPSS